MNQSDVTLNSLILPSLEEGNQDVSLGFETIQCGLSSSTLPRHVASIFQEQSFNMLPDSLTRSTRHALASSTASTILASSIYQRHSNLNEHSDISLLNASTSSYRDHRDSPVRPGLVSIQAERISRNATPKRRNELGDNAEIKDSTCGSDNSSHEHSSDLKGMLRDWESTGEMFVHFFPMFILVLPFSDCIHRSLA